jgi:hypothetical protein
VRASPRDGAALRSALIESFNAVRELAGAVLRGAAARRSRRTR